MKLAFISAWKKASVQPQRNANPHLSHRFAERCASVIWNAFPHTTRSHLSSIAHLGQVVMAQLFTAALGVTNPASPMKLLIRCQAGPAVARPLVKYLHFRQQIV